jgi:hypothetical protein
MELLIWSFFIVLFVELWLLAVSHSAVWDFIMLGGKKSKHSIFFLITMILERSFHRC